MSSTAMKRVMMAAAASLLALQANAATISRTHRHKTAAVRTPVPAMASERATQIQTALIKAGYLSGDPSGVWDASSQAAMQKYQGDNGWQTRMTPDARALTRLGLGSQPAASSATQP